MWSSLGALVLVLASLCGLCEGAVCHASNTQAPMRAGAFRGLRQRQAAPSQRMRGGGPPRASVCVIGSGNWGCAIARVIALNTKALPEFESQVCMWVYEEEVGGRNLTDIINTDHENPKYLPGVTLPANVVAVSDLATAVQDATILVWVLPHQFIGRLLPSVKGASPLPASLLLF